VNEADRRAADTIARRTASSTGSSPAGPLSDAKDPGRSRTAEKKRLYLVTSMFAEVEPHPDAVPNAEMGDLFEHLIHKFAEASNEEAGEHYTPRDAIRLIVDLLFAEDDKALLGDEIPTVVLDQPQDFSDLGGHDRQGIGQLAR
jgi:hypothetical protein